MAKLSISIVAVFLIAVCGLSYGQDLPPDSISWFHANQEVRLSHLPSLTVPSSDGSAVVAVAVEIAVRDPGICCGSGSALENVALSDLRSLRELAVRIQGRYFLSDGRPILIRTEYFPQSAINPGTIIGALSAHHPLLFEWKDQMYVLSGVVFNETLYNSGRRDYAITRLLLLDPRFSDQRREVEFNRESDNWGQVEGILNIDVASQ